MAGDCIGKLQLAHVGLKKVWQRVEHMFEGSPIPVDYDLVPKCIRIQKLPIGKNLEQAKAQNIKARAYKIPFKAIGVQ